MNEIIKPAEMAEHFAPLLDLYGALKRIEELDLENERITRIIKDRLKLHQDFIGGALGAGVEPSPSIYAATAELRTLLREIEK
jgi:hypothetical protein